MSKSFAVAVEIARRNRREAAKEAPSVAIPSETEEKFTSIAEAIRAKSKKLSEVPTIDDEEDDTANLPPIEEDDIDDEPVGPSIADKIRAQAKAKK